VNEPDAAAGPPCEGDDPLPGAKIRIGVSTCLLGEHVRYDAGHKHDRYITDVLGRHFDLVGVCPEVEAGMGTPREPVRLVRQDDAIRMRGVKSGADHTTAMQSFARRRVAEIARLGLSGYILKKGSPSCGMERVRTYTAAGMPAPAARGMFAEELLKAVPLLPVEEEGRLADDVLRESFIERVFAYARVELLLSTRWNISGLVAFHTNEKMLIAAHKPSAEKALGRIVAEAARRPRADVGAEYRQGFLEALSRPAPRKRHVNVLLHVLGHFRGVLEPVARGLVLGVIEEYRAGLVPLVVPITLVRHYAALHGIEYLARQTYLEPHPRELLLRNHA
jgi:uncharacterized protein YbgA (DUF1722 family)/uncharacterized protein YbbK (DUF523 family)